MTETARVELTEAVRKDSGALIVLGIVTVIFGFFAMMAPLLTGVAVAMMVGILLVAGGIARFVFAFKCRSWGMGILAFGLGVLALACGIAMIARPLLGLASLTLILAFYFVADGLVEIVEAFQLRPLRGWGWMLFGGAVSLFLGLMIWRQWPVSGAWAIGILVGIKLFFAGWSMMGIGAAGRSVAGKKAPAEA